MPHKLGERDALDLTDAERDALVAEARAAFDANTAVFDDLQVATAGR